MGSSPEIIAAQAALATATQACSVTSEALADLRRRLADAREKVAAIERRELTDDAANLARGISPAPLSREDARALESARRTAAAIEALSRAERDHATATAALELASADLCGAIWQWTCERQEAMRAEIERQLETLAPSLASLIAIDQIRDSMVSGPLHLPGDGSAQPWAGRVLARNLIAHLPQKLKGQALQLESVHRLAIINAAELTREIEG